MVTQIIFNKNLDIIILMSDVYKIYFFVIIKLNFSLEQRKK